MENFSIKRWAWAIVGSLFLGTLIQGLVQSVTPVLLPEKPVMALFPLDLSLGLTIGTIQALVLRRYIPHVWTWAIATGIGLSVAEIVAGFILHDNMGLKFGFYRSPLPEALLSLAIVGLSLGICVGSIQWLVLYQAGYRTLLWVPATSVGLTAAIALADYLAVPEAFIGTFFGILFGIILGGLIYGFLTGLVLTRLSRSKQYIRD